MGTTNIKCFYDSFSYYHCEEAEFRIEVDNSMSQARISRIGIKLIRIMSINGI